MNGRVRELVPPSPGPALVIADALLTTGMATAGATGGLLLCYWLCRVALDQSLICSPDVLLATPAYP